MVPLLSSSCCNTTSLLSSISLIYFQRSYHHVHFLALALDFSFGFLIFGWIKSILLTVWYIYIGHDGDVSCLIERECNERDRSFCIFWSLLYQNTMVSKKRSFLGVLCAFCLLLGANAANKCAESSMPAGSDNQKGCASICLSVAKLHIRLSCPSHAQLAKIIF